MKDFLAYPEYWADRAALFEECPRASRLHIEKGEEITILRNLRDYGVLKWAPESDMIAINGKPLVNSMFGVRKGDKLDDGRWVLRLIMALVCSNELLMTRQGKQGCFHFSP